MLERILKQKAMISTILFAVFVGGIFAYMNIGKLEDAEIPIKSAMVITPYPGATAHEVELEVTDVLEKSLQKLENVKEITSVSQPGLSLITINLEDKVLTPQLPQMWDHLRRKVGDVKGNLPSGAYDPIVNDDFADVYGMLYAVTADGYSKTELRKYTEFLERELLEVDGVKRSQIFGTQQEAVDIIFSPEKLANLKINPMYIAMAMQNQSAIVNPGSVETGKESIRVGVGNKINSVQQIEDLLIQVPQGGTFRLGDIAEVKRSYMEPMREALFFNGKMALSLGLSNESGVNVVKLGEVLDIRMEELKQDLPAGIEVHKIYSQPARVDVAVKDFMWNLIMSVGIVIIVLLFSMGYRSGLLISSGLVFTIFATLIVMMSINLSLHRITLAAIILAMGMLVDNAIVVADGILVDLKKGVPRRKAFVKTAQQTAMPLLGATAVAILAFLPLAMSPNTAGEFLSSLFTVLIISLSLSWVFAMVQTPFMAKYFYRKERPQGEKAEQYDSKFYKGFKNIINWSIYHKKFFLSGSVLALVISLYFFKFVKFEFMSPIEYDQFVVEYNLPVGSSIEAVGEDLNQIEEYVQSLDGISFVTTALGRPAARYTLMRIMPTGGNNYGELLIETESIERVAEIMPDIRKHIAENYPDANFRLHTYGAAFSDYDIEAEFSGPDPKVLRELAEKAKNILRDEPSIETLTDNWKNEVKIISPKYSVDRAQRLGLSRSDMGNSILVATDGMPIGSYYEGDDMIPILLKTNSPIEENIEQLKSVPVWGQQSQFSTPLEQIIDTLALEWESEKVNRFNGKRAIKVQFDAKSGYTANDVYARVNKKIEEMELPHGYKLRWDGTVANSEDANKALFAFLPLAVGLMLIIIIGLFNNLKQPAIIFMIVPFAFVGVSLGFNITGANLTFVGIIGALGLIGMMIKNSVVLLDEINIGIKEGKTKLQATIDAAISRLRPVMMASLTTILGMLPLITDPMFQSLSITIMFGLLVGSVITLLVVPVAYTVFYNVDGSSLRK